MNAGIEVYNNDGKLVIDENYRNLCLTRKIPIESLPLIRPGSGYRGYVLKLNEGEQLFAFELRPYKRLIIYPYRIDERTWVLHFPYGDSGVGHNMTEAELQGTHVYVFGLQLQPSGKRWGLEVYNSRGELCFDSNSKYMRVTRFKFKKANEPQNGYFYEPPEYETIGSVSNESVALVCIAVNHHGLSSGIVSNGLYTATIVVKAWDGLQLYTEINHTLIYYPDDLPDEYPVDCYERYKYNAMNGYGYMLLNVTNY